MLSLNYSLLTKFNYYQNPQIKFPHPFCFLLVQVRHTPTSPSWSFCIDFYNRCMSSEKKCGQAILSMNLKEC